MKVAIADLGVQSGKTTLALNLSVALAEGGAQVLMVDADPEGQWDALDGLSEAGTVLDRQGLRMLRTTAVPGLQVVTGMGRWLAQPGNTTADLGRLGDLFPQFDWVLFDTGARHQTAVESVLRLSDRVLTPLPVESAAFRHVPDTLRLLVAEHATKPELSFTGFVRYHVHPLTPEAHDTEAAAQASLAMMRQEFPQVCLATEIPFDPALGQRQAAGAPCLAPSAPTREAFAALAQEMADRVGRAMAPSGSMPSPTPRAPESPMPSAAPEVKRRGWWRRFFGRRR